MTFQTIVKFGAEQGGGGWVCDSLRVELDAGGCGGRSADDSVAVVGRASHEQECHVLVEDMKMAIGLGQRDEDGFVCGDELEMKLRELMELEKGKEMRERSWKMRVMAMSATSESGSSTEALKKLVETWKATHE
ncbi:UDP-glycosyltransferase 88F3-like [Senna tora]|uniref:UDP-glycosyltransferase 88F3-like n=1 Tax=Senna tora TaxID=362788 RepID=A0A834X822_9FABA|nr:UDP-glycosyltransferase 88F3-like [Senna tora]